MKKITALVTLVVLVIVGLSAFERGFRGERGEKREMYEQHHEMYDNPFDELDLSKEQQEKIEDARVEMKKDIIPIKSEIDILQIEKHEALKDENFSQVKQLIKDISKKRTAIQFIQIDHKEEVSKILTDEQKELLKKNMLRGMRKNKVNRMGNIHRMKGIGPK